jgi:hypothetical protein
LTPSKSGTLLYPLIAGNKGDRIVIAQPTIRIIERNLHPHTGAVQALTIAVAYGDGVEAEATILLRPGVVLNDENSIREEIERLGRTILSAAQSPSGITS